MYCLIYITVPNKKEAKKIGQILVRERLAACCNIFPIESVYRWSSFAKASEGKQGKIEKEKEFGMFVKTKKKLVGKVIKRVKGLHSYEVPCIISLPIEKGYQKFLNWIEKSTI